MNRKNAFNELQKNQNKRFEIPGPICINSTDFQK